MLRPLIARYLVLASLLGLAGSLEARTKVIGPMGNPVASLPGGKGKRLVVGVMGGAGKHVSPKLVRALRELGDEIAEQGHVTLTGACPGYPHEVLSAAKAKGGLTIGISGARNRSDHVARGAPTEGFDVLQYTSLPPAQRGQNRPNYMGREIDNIERSDALIFVAGRSGTLGEFAIAYEEGRPIGVLKGSGGVTDEIRRLVQVMEREGKPPQAPIVYDSNPRRLVKRLAKAAKQPRGPLKWEG